jgi:hypothetical protein
MYFAFYRIWLAFSNVFYILECTVYIDFFLQYIHFVVQLRINFLYKKIYIKNILLFAHLATFSSISIFLRWYILQSIKFSCSTIFC